MFIVTSIEVLVRERLTYTRVFNTRISPRLFPAPFSFLCCPSSSRPCHAPASVPAPEKEKLFRRGTRRRRVSSARALFGLYPSSSPRPVDIEGGSGEGRPAKRWGCRPGGYRPWRLWRRLGQVRARAPWPKLPAEAGDREGEEGGRAATLGFRRRSREASTTLAWPRRGGVRRVRRKNNCEKKSDIEWRETLECWLARSIGIPD